MWIAHGLATRPGAGRFATGTPPALQKRMRASTAPDRRIDEVIT